MDNTEYSRLKNLADTGINDRRGYMSVRLVTLDGKAVFLPASSPSAHIREKALMVEGL